jgi:hypothetical protein
MLDHAQSAYRPEGRQSDEILFLSLQVKRSPLDLLMTSGLDRPAIIYAIVHRKTL